MTHWPSYNQSLVRRGEILFSYDFLDVWDSELEGMNKNKEGKPYLYPNSFILAIGYIRTYFRLPYRQTEGIIKATGRSLPNHPCYEQICKRINKLNIDDSNSEISESEDIVIAIDSTGIRVTNRGQWLRDKWFVKKKGYLKIHIAVNIKTKEILALEVTDDKVHDGKMMCKLVDHILKQNNAVSIKTVLADGAYDSNKNFKYLQKKRILPGINVRKNSIIAPKNNKVRNGEVRNQTRDLLKWKKKRGYGKRWMAETAFSSIKRMFGECVSATKFQNMIKEMMVKVSIYNLFRSRA
ncbi:MAG: IS5 family transposase [Candidatus Nitrosocosmicus sp.]